MDQRREGRDWAARCAAAIGWCVANYRGERKLSAQQLADRCAELGAPSLSRVVITKLENGRREAVSTSELAVLARALDVPPVLLLFPLGRVETVEVLPGLEVDPYAAIHWFAGNTSDPADLAAVTEDLAMGEIVLWNEHERYNSELSVTQKALDVDNGLVRTAAGEDQAREARERVERTLQYADTARQALRRVRLNMRGQGLILPPLHPETARLLGPEPGGEADHGAR